MRKNDAFKQMRGRLKGLLATVMIATMVLSLLPAVSAKASAAKEYYIVAYTAGSSVFVGEGTVNNPSNKPGGLYEFVVNPSDVGEFHYSFNYIDYYLFSDSWKIKDDKAVELQSISSGLNPDDSVDIELTEKTKIHYGIISGGMLQGLILIKDGTKEGPVYQSQSIGETEIGPGKISIKRLPNDNYCTQIEIKAAEDTPAQPKEWELTYFEDTEGTKVSKTEKIADGTSLSAYGSYVPPAKPNYTFAGWATEKGIVVDSYYEKDGKTLNSSLVGKVVDWSKNITESMEVYPIWIHDRLEINIDKGAVDAVLDSSQSTRFTVNLNEKIVMRNLKGATRPGYELAGWYTKGGTLWNGTNWKELDYAASGWTEKEGWPVTPEYCDKNTDGSDYIRTNDIRKFNYYTVTLTAHWTPKKINVEYDTGGGSVVPSDTKSYGLGETITLPGAPDKAGQAFTGWKAGNSSTLHSAGEQFAFNDWSLVSGNKLIFTAQYIDIPTNAVTFDSDGGTAVAPVEIHDGESISEPPVTTKTGYTFKGWYSGDTRIDFPYAVSEAIILKARWQVNQYTISFDSKGGSSVADIKQDYGTKIVSPANPTREHYSFEGWHPSLPDTMPANDIALEAMWTPAKYTITFKNDGRENKVEDIYGAKITPPDPGEKAGMTFAGWEDRDGNLGNVPEYMPDNNPTYTAKWKVKLPKVEARENLVYNGSPQQLVTAEEGTVYYSLSRDGKYTTSIPSAADAGTYHVWYKASEEDTDPVMLSVTIKKADASITKLPVGAKLTYTGKLQALVSGGSASVGSLQYAIGTDDKTAPTTGWSTSIPTATDAGTYYVWYRVESNGNYSNVTPGCVKAVIEKQPDTKEESKEEPKEQGEIQTQTDIAKDVPKTSVSGLTTDLAKSLLTTDEKKEVESGAKLTISLEVTNITDSVPAKDKKKSEEAALEASSSAKVGMFLDLSLYKKIGSKKRSKISSLKGKTFTVTVDVPDNLKAPSGKIRTYYLIRVHNGKAEILAKTKNTKITFKTGEFSTYALAYSDVSDGESQPGNSGSGKTPAGTGGTTNTSSGGYSTGGYSTGASYSTSTGTTTSGGGGGGSSYTGDKHSFFVKNVEYRITSRKKKTAALVWSANRKMMTIPATIKRRGKIYKVTAIDDRAFNDCRSIRTVVIGKNVKKIGKRAFAGCTKLRKVDIRTKLLNRKSIGKDAFKGVKKSSIKYPDGMGEYRKFLK